MDNTTQVNSSSSPPNELQCQLLDEKIVNCSSQVYSNRDAWRSSRSYINDQIRRLRAQLSELKVRHQTEIQKTSEIQIFGNRSVVESFRFRTVSEFQTIWFGFLMFGLVRSVHFFCARLERFIYIKKNYIKRSRLN